MIFQCIHQTKSSLTYQMPTKNMWYLGHIQINLFVDETHLTHQKSDPSDPYYLGHSTHFQPCCRASYISYKTSYTSQPNLKFLKATNPI